MKPKTKAQVLEYKNLFSPDYSTIHWVMKQTPRDLETNEGLFFITENVSMIFTRMYHYRDNMARNVQTARIGIDYACPGQVFNHIPGAASFNRKDFLQYYLLDYERRYKARGLGYCFSTPTPKSFILDDKDHCELFIETMSELLEKHEKDNWPIEWITKNAVRHKGYGIELIDYEKAKYYKNLYTENKDVSCSNVLDSHKFLIAQKYISNPALVYSI